MPNFIITYDYTDAVITDAQTTMVRFYAYNRLDRWIIPILGLTGLVATFILQDWPPLILSAATLLQFILAHLAKKRAIQNEKERVALLNKEKPPQLSWTFDTDQRQIISFKNGKEANSFDLTDVIGLIDTSTLLIIRLKGKLYVPLPKTAFEEGTPSDLLAWFKATYPNLKVWRR